MYFPSRMQGKLRVNYVNGHKKNFDIRALQSIRAVEAISIVKNPSGHLVQAMFPRDFL
jgi:hypothetical protein